MILVKKIYFNLIELIKVLLLGNITGYSELLIAFALFNVLTLIFFNEIKKE
jgi:hypothetical protein